MANNQVVTTAVFKAEEQGVDKTVASLNRLDASAAKAGASAASFGKQTAAAYAELERAQKRSETALNKSMSGMATPGIVKQIDQSARAFAQIERQANNVRKAIDPVYRDLAKFEDAQKKLNAAAEAGAISWQKHGELVEVARTKFVDAHKAIAVANDNIRLTSGQVQNLGYQLNDAATMLLMGASPFQIMASQGGQVVQALGDGPGGVKGSLSAIGSSIASFARSIPVAGYAIAGVTTAVGALWYLTSGPKAREAEASVKSFQAAVSRLESGWRGAGVAAEEHFAKAQRAANGNQSAALLDTQAELKKLREDYKNAVRDLNTASGLPEQILRARSGGVSPAHQQIRDLYTDLRKGEITAAEFSAKLLEIRLDPAADRFARSFAESIRQGVGHATELEQRINAIADTTAKLGGKGGRVTGAAEANPFDLRDRFGGVTGAAGRLDPAGMDNVRDQLRAQRGELEGYVLAAKQAQDALANFDLSPLQRELAETTQEYDRRIAAYKQSTNDTIGLSALQQEKEAALALITKEATRSEETRRAGYALDLKAASDVTAAQKAATAGQRAYNAAIAEGYDKSYASARSAEASAISFAQAEQSASEALRRSKESREQAGLEGYAAQFAAINAQYAEQIRLAQGSEAAVRALTEARDLDLQTLQVSTQRGLLANQEEQLRTLQAEAGLIGMNDDARRVALAGLEAEAELRRQGIPLNDAWGQSYVANARKIATMDVALDKQQDAFDDLKEAASGFFETLASGGSVMDALTGAFGKFAQQLASKGFDQLFGGLFGKGGSNSPSVLGAITQAASQIPAYGSNMGVEKTLSAPVGAVTRAPLPPLVTGEGFSFSKASSVARQSVPAQVWNFFASKGLASHQIAGIMGNAKAESGFNPSARGDAGAALGLFQWNDRANAMKAFVGQNWQSNVQGQLDFAWKELQTSESKAYRALLQATNVTQATEAFLGFERPHGYNTGVRNSHNYSGRVGFAQDAFRQFEGTSVKSDSIVAVSKRDAEKAFENGAARGIERGVESYASGRFDGSAPAPSGGLFGARGQAGFQVLGAGIGAFGNGYQSGSPLSGGLSGAFSGYGAGGAISSFLGVGAGAGAALGVVGGAALGIIGGILGARKQRQEAHKQAAAKWAEMRPAYEEFDRSLSGEKQGDLRKYVTEGWGQLSQFMSVGGAAWKMGTGNSTAQFDSTGRKLFEGFLKMLGDFRDGFDSMITDMSSGQGLQGAFAKGRNATKELADQIKKTRDDVDIAFGNIASIDFLNTPGAQAQAEETAKSRADAIARYNDAAAKYALSLLYSAEKFSDVQQTIDGLRGTAAGLVPIFADLGWNADEAAKAINDRLSAAIANIARELEQTLADRIDDLNGKGYFATVRDFLDEYAGLQRDFAAAGADGSRLPEFFKLQAQEIVNGAELTGDAFAELIRLFPDLSGVVVEAGKAVGASTAEIADAIKGYEERLFDAQSGSNELARIERKLAADRIEAAKFGADALAMFEKAAAAERANAALSDARNVLDRSYQAETDRINDLLSARRDEASELESTISKLESFRDQVKEFRDSLKLDDNLSTLNAQDRVTEAGRQFRDLLAKAQGGDEDARGRLTGAAQEYLNEAKGYYQTSTDYGAIFEEVNRALADTQDTSDAALTTAEAQLAEIKRQITVDETQLEVMKTQYNALLGINDGIKSLAAAMAAYAAAATVAKDAGVTVPGNPGAAKPVGDRTASYLANNPDVAKAIAAGQTFGAGAGSTIEAIVQDHWTRHGQYEVGKGTRVGYSSGGFTGMGGVNDVAGVVHGQEYVMDAVTTRSIGVPMLDMMRQTRSLPTIAMPASPRMVGSGNDNRGIEQRLDAMQRTLIALTTTTGGGLQRVAEAGEAGARATEQRALAERRSANNKQAA